MRNRTLAPAFFCIALAVLGCGQRHTSIVGKWVHPLGGSGNAGMVYEFRPNGTCSQYSYVDMRKQIPGSDITFSPKFSGTYTFRKGYLVYSLASVKAEEGTASMPHLDGDTLTLSQSGGRYEEGPPEGYQRQ